MKIDHVALFTGHPESMLAFYQKYFGAIEYSHYHNERTGLQIWVLAFDKGAHLEISNVPGFTYRPPERDTGYAHISIAAGGREEVDFLTGRLAADGYTIVSEPRVTGEGYYESCVMDPDGNWVEIKG